ncbi:MAG TPA: Gfo/Idh/MocA family oxidoreductase [Vicinamibacterales bacterium]|nr:Gfo/Idh/MocA family oxidoreductase [Vicinamibacterales bacterium]
MSDLRAAVVGVGHLGRHHARILGSTPGVKLVAVVDRDRAKAEEHARASGAGVFTDAGELDGMEIDAVSVAVPTESHLEVANPLLARGIGVLVEKPMTRSLDEADRMIAAAKAGGAVLAVGHTERFNPAVEAALPHVTAPKFIEVHRLSPFPERSLDIDVIFDLMIHDLDIVRAMVRSEVTDLEAVGVPVLSPRFDIANVRLKFESGCIANLTASRISKDRVRKLRVFQRDAYISIDYAEQQVEAYRLDRAGERPAIAGGSLPIEKEEPLRREIEDFLDAVRTGRAPRVTGEDGRAALALADRIAGAMIAVT